MPQQLMTNGNGSNGNGSNGDTPQPDPIQKLTEYVESVEISLKIQEGDITPT
ncbi:hypothetical protein QUA56_22345 [Microcoleus sp. N3A4]|uniref:hypothetical protein n=1 Tax=Microcoleus sp. N3A4 TaxID=3055379 RepID=UPI002FD31B59